MYIDIFISWTTACYHAVGFWLSWPRKALYPGICCAISTDVLINALVVEVDRKRACIMSRSQQRQSHIANWRRTVYDDDPEPVPIQHGIEAVPITPGLEQIPAERHRQANAPQLVLGGEEKEILAEYDHGRSESHPSVCGMPRKWLWILLGAVAVAIGIAVAVGVGVRAKQARNNSS